MNKKKMKLISIPLSLIMIINGMAGCSNNVKENDETKNQNTVMINDREYEFTDDSIVYRTDVTQNSYDVSKDLNVSTTDLLVVSNENDETEISVPYDVYKNGHNKMGVIISEVSGVVDWNIIKHTCDFVYLECYDFYDQDFDKKYEEYAKKCEELEIPYGIIIQGNTPLVTKETKEKVKQAKKDAKFIHKILKKWNTTMPTLYEISGQKRSYYYYYKKYGKEAPFEEMNQERRELVMELSSPSDDISSDAEKYVATLIDELKNEYMDFTMLYTDYGVYDDLFDIYEKNYSSKDATELTNKELYELWNSSDPAVANQFIITAQSKSRIDDSKMCMLNEYYDKYEENTFLGISNPEDMVQVFYDETPKDYKKLFTISSDFKNAKEKLKKGNTKVNLGFFTLLGALGATSLVLANKLYNSLPEEEQYELARMAAEPIIKTKRKRKNKKSKKS